jgi:hypothetical protein
MREKRKKRGEKFGTGKKKPSKRKGEKRREDRTR